VSGRGLWVQRVSACVGVWDKDDWRLRIKWLSANPDVPGK